MLEEGPYWKATRSQVLTLLSIGTSPPAAINAGAARPACDGNFLSARRGGSIIRLRGGKAVQPFRALSGVEPLFI